MPSPTALIAGATGLVGARCLDLLIGSGAYSRVVAVTRRPLAVSHPRLDQRVVRFEEFGAVELPEIRDVFCALGTPIAVGGSQAEFRRVDFDYPCALARRALESGARQFLLVSSVEADAGSRNFCLRVKGELEDTVSALPFSAVHIFRPSFLVGERSELRLAESLGGALFRAAAFALAGPLRKYRPIEASTVAAAMTAAALAARGGRHVYHYDEIISLAR